MGCPMTADEFVGVVARLMTREEANPVRHYELPPIGYGDAEDALDALIYTAREVLREQQT